MIGETISPSRKVSEDRKQLTEDEQNLQGVVQREVCNHLYAERYPTGYSGTLEPFKVYRCDITRKNCVAYPSVLGNLALAFRKGTGASEGLDIRVAKRCPSRKVG